METLTKWYLKLSEGERGQTMTEYVLIIAAVAVAGYTAYVSLAGGITNIVSSVTSTLSGSV